MRTFVGESLYLVENAPSRPERDWRQRDSQPSPRRETASGQRGPGANPTLTVLGVFGVTGCSPHSLSLL